MSSTFLSRAKNCIYTIRKKEKSLVIEGPKLNPGSTDMWLCEKLFNFP